MSRQNKKPNISHSSKDDSREKQPMKRSATKRKILTLLKKNKTCYRSSNKIQNGSQNIGRWENAKQNKTIKKLIITIEDREETHTI